MKRQLPILLVLATLICAATEIRADEPPATNPLTLAIRVEDFAAANKSITPELVNQSDLGGYHPLTYAVYTRNQPLVKALLDGGANPNTVEQDGATSLSVAACLNQPEIIKTLHRAGATYPTATNALPPVANAVQADAVESLKVLLELYPALDINAGWPWPKYKWNSLQNTGADENNPHFARSALIFSSVAGFDAMTRLLLDHGADVSKRTNYGFNALHYATQNPRISSETIAALVIAGLDPDSRSSHEHYKPSTPLELACAEGSLANVTVLSEKLDPRSHADRMRRAALIGSAHGHGEIASFLYRKIGEELPTIKRFIQQHPDPRKNKKDFSGHDLPIPTDDITTPMPASHPITDEARQGPAPGTIAVIASATLQNHASMLTQTLSNLDGLTVVERDAITRVAEEKLLGEFGKGRPSGKAPDLDLIPAAQIVFLEDLMVSKRRFIKATLISTGTRVVEQRMVMEYSDAGETWVETKLAACLDTIHRVRDRGPGAVALSLIPLTPNIPSQEGMELSRYANLLLPAKISQQPGAVLLNLQQMRDLDAENAIAGKDSYWKAAWVIEGTVSLDSSKSARVVLGATPTVQGDRVEVAVTCDSGKLADGLDKAWKALATKLSLANAAGGTRPNKISDPAGEAKLLAQQARWFIDANYPEDAYELASAAFLLGDQSEDLLQTMTEAAIDRLPVLRSRYCKHISGDPRVLEPAIRCRMPSTIPDYLTLCDSARLYVAKLNKRLVSRMRGTKSSSGGSESYNDVVSHALSELYFFRLMLDDSIIKAGNRDELRNLDKQIGALTTEFMAKLKDHEYEARTLCNLVFPTSNRFPVIHDPELRVRVLDRLAATATGENKYGAVDLMSHLHRWYNTYHGSYRGSDPYAKIVETLSSSPALFRQRPDLVEQLRAISAADTNTRIAAMRRMIELAAQPGTTAQYFGFDNCEWERFLGASPANKNEHTFSESRLLNGGYGGLIFNPGKDFGKTGEFSRMSGWYSTVLRWATIEPNRLEEELTLKADLIAKESPKKRPHPSNILGMRVMLKNINRLTPSIGRILDQLAPPEAGKSDTAEQKEKLKLQPLLSLPQSPGQSQFARPIRAALDSDQLWLPVTYLQNSDYLWRKSEEKNARHHSIHVIDLATRKIRTILLPNDVPDRGVDAFYTSRTGFRKLILGTKHAYYVTGLTPGLFVYAIDRKTLAVKRVELPLPYVIEMSDRTVGDRLYLSIGQEWDIKDKSAPRPASAVLAIEGSEIKETLVSNQRKPSQTPLDAPSTFVDLIGVQEGHITLISNQNFSFQDPDSYQGARYDSNDKVWKKFSKQEVDHARQQIRANQSSQFISTRQISPDPKSQYFAGDIYRGSVPNSLILVNSSNYHSTFLAEWLKQPRMSGRFKLLPVSADPLEGEPQMDRQMYLLDPDEIVYSEAETASRSANQIIQSAIYDATVCCKWRDEFLVFLSYRGVAMPAIWSVSESEIQKITPATETR